MRSMEENSIESDEKKETLHGTETVDADEEANGRSRLTPPVSYGIAAIHNPLTRPASHRAGETVHRGASALMAVRRRIFARRRRRQPVPLRPQVLGSSCDGLDFDATYPVQL